jgi:hypothetical protein
MSFFSWAKKPEPDPDGFSKWIFLNDNDGFNLQQNTKKNIIIIIHKNNMCTYRECGGSHNKTQTNKKKCFWENKKCKMEFQFFFWKNFFQTYFSNTSNSTRTFHPNGSFIKSEFMHMILSLFFIS